MGDAGRAPKTRFSDRVTHYLKARPGYPRAVLTLLQQECGLSVASTVVDVASGTGLFAKVLCESGCRVIGVEPNAEMRAAGEAQLAGCERFQMLEGCAESLPLANGSADLITVAQAFHWLDLPAARCEFIRVLKPNGWAVVVWNDRHVTGSRLAGDYENLVVRFGTDYSDVQHRAKDTDACYAEFFGHTGYRRASYPNAQQLDYDGFVARVLSSSYMPGPKDEHFAAMMTEVARVFRAHENAGVVRIEYTTSVIFGQMA